MYLSKYMLLDYKSYRLSHNVYLKSVGRQILQERLYFIVTIYRYGSSILKRMVFGTYI